MNSDPDHDQAATLSAALQSTPDDSRQVIMATIARLEHMVAQADQRAAQAEYTAQQAIYQQQQAAPAATHAPRAPAALRHPMPTFKGAYLEDPFAWVSLLNDHLVLNSVPQELWAANAAVLLEDLAREWYQQWLKSLALQPGQVVPWGQFYDAFLERFASPTRAADIRNRLNQLKYKGDMTDYIRRFSRLAGQLSDGEMTYADRQFFFCQALPVDAHIQILRSRPTNVEALYDAARDYDRVLRTATGKGPHALTHSAQRGGGSKHASRSATPAAAASGSSFGDTPMDLDTFQVRGGRPQRAPAPNARSGPRCYNCSDVGHFSRDCPLPQKRRFPQHPQQCRVTPHPRGNHKFNTLEVHDEPNLIELADAALPSSILDDVFETAEETAAILACHDLEVYSSFNTKTTPEFEPDNFFVYAGNVGCQRARDVYFDPLSMNSYIRRSTTEAILRGDWANHGIYTAIPERPAPFVSPAGNPIREQFMFDIAFFDSARFNVTAMVIDDAELPDSYDILLGVWFWRDHAMSRLNDSRGTLSISVANARQHDPGACGTRHRFEAVRFHSKTRPMYFKEVDSRPPSPSPPPPDAPPPTLASSAATRAASEEPHVEDGHDRLDLVMLADGSLIPVNEFTDSDDDDDNLPDLVTPTDSSGMSPLYAPLSPAYDAADPMDVDDDNASSAPEPPRTSRKRTFIDLTADDSDDDDGLITQTAKRSRGPPRRYITDPRVLDLYVSRDSAALPLYPIVANRNHEGRALLDNGASANFITRTFVDTVGATAHPLKAARQISGAGELTTCEAAHLWINIAGNVEHVYAFVIDIDREWDLVLGRPWLKDHMAYTD